VTDSVDFGYHELCGRFIAIWSPQHAVALLDSGRLSAVARSIYINRHAKGMPPNDRIKIAGEFRDPRDPKSMRKKTVSGPGSAWKLLRKTIRLLRCSRDALLVGDVATYELRYAEALMNWHSSQTEFFRPYANRSGESNKGLAKNGKTARAEGGRTISERFARPGLRDLIIGCLERGEPMRARKWMDEYNMKKDAVYRLIRRVKAQQR